MSETKQKEEDKNAITRQRTGWLVIAATFKCVGEPGSYGTDLKPARKRPKLQDMK